MARFFDKTDILPFSIKSLFSVRHIEHRVQTRNLLYYNRHMTINIEQASQDHAGSIGTKT